MATIKLRTTVGGAKLSIDGGTTFEIDNQDVTTSIRSDNAAVILRWDGLDHPFSINHSFDIDGEILTGDAALIKSAIDEFLNAGRSALTLAKGLNLFNVSNYGAKGDGTTDDSTAFQSAFSDSFAASGNYYIYIPKGRYKIASQILIDSATSEVYIEGNDSTILDFVSVSENAVIRIKQAKNVQIQNLKFDQTGGSTVLHNMIYLGDFASAKNVGTPRIINCDFFGFVAEGNRGIKMENIRSVVGGNSGYNVPNATISNCNFYNTNTVAFASMDYATATYYGIGIYLGEYSEYIKVINNNFQFIRIGLYSYGGANSTVTGNNFLACLPKLNSVYTYGAIFVDNTGSNNGKINITSNKFNHNWGYSIYSKYAVLPDRPLTISDNHFIANCATPIFLTHTANIVSECIINNNWFERASQAFTNGIANQPFGAALLPFITLNNYSNNFIKGNSFKNDGTYGVVSTGDSTNNVIRDNKWVGIIGIASLVNTNYLFNNELASITSGNGSLLVKGTSTASFTVESATGFNAFSIYTINGIAQGYIGVPGAINGFITGSAVGDLCLRSENKKLLISTNSSADSIMIFAANNAGIGIGATPSTSAILEIASTTKGFLLPRMTKVQRNAISSPPDGLAVYQTDNTPGLRVRENGAWVRYTATVDA